MAAVTVVVVYPADLQAAEGAASNVGHAIGAGAAITSFNLCEASAASAAAAAAATTVKTVADAGVFASWLSVVPLTVSLGPFGAMLGGALFIVAATTASSVSSSASAAVGGAAGIVVAAPVCGLLAFVGTDGLWHQVVQQVKPCNRCISPPFPANWRGVET